MSTRTAERTYSSAEACEATGATYRELDYWVRAGLLTAADTGPQRGDLRAPDRRWSWGDLQRISALKLLRLAGIELGAIRQKGFARLRADLEHALDAADRAGLE